MHKVNTDAALFEARIGVGAVMQDGVHRGYYGSIHAVLSIAKVVWMLHKLLLLDMESKSLLRAGLSSLIVETDNMKLQCCTMLCRRGN